MGFYNKAIVVFFIAAIHFNFTAPVLAKETVVWTLNDFIPFYIKKGSFKGQGISDKLTIFFQKRLPEYTHHQEQMNLSRFFALAKRGDLVCNPLLLKTPERVKTLAYSKAFKPAYAHVLVSKHPVDDSSKGISLEEFLKTDHHNLIVQTKRSYGPLLDKIIKDERRSGRIEEHVFPTNQLFQMMDNGRIDHFIDIENSAVYFEKLHPEKGRFYRVSLTEDRLNRFGYAVCSKTEAGKILIGKINKILQNEGASNDFRDILESWVAAENIKRFRTFYDREILKK